MKKFWMVVENRGDGDNVYIHRHEERSDAETTAKGICRCNLESHCIIMEAVGVVQVAVSYITQSIPYANEPTPADEPKCTFTQHDDNGRGSN